MRWPGWMQKRERTPVSPAWQRYREALDEERKRSIWERSYLVFDLETTGLDPDKDRILSFAFLLVKAGQIDLSTRWEGFLAQQDDAALTAADIHQVTKGDTAQGWTEASFVTEMLRFVGSHTLVGHHVAFDIACLNQALSRHGLPPLENDRVGTARLGARLENPLMGSYGGQKALKKLDTLCQQYGLAPEARHSASGDTYTTALLFLKLWKSAQHRKISSW